MMKDKLKKMMDKRKDGAGSMSDPEKKAKMSVLQDLHKMASDAMAGRLKDVKRVEVAGDSDESIMQGLDHAKHMIEPDEEHIEEDTQPDHGHGDLMPEDEEGAEHEALESPEEEASEHDADEDMPEEEIDAKLEKLMALKKRKGLR